MYKEKMAILEAMAKIPGLKELDIPIEDILCDDEFNRLTDDVMAALNVDLKTPSFDADMALLLDADGGVKVDHPAATRPVSAPTAVGSKRSRPVTIRIPEWLLNAYREKALDKGVGYQTLIVRNLKEAARNW